MRSIRCVISSASSSPMWPRSTRSHTMEQSRSRKAFILSGILATSHHRRGLGIPPDCRGRCRRRKHRLHHPHHIARVYLIQPPHDPLVSRLVDHSGVSHVGGEKQQIHAPPVDASCHRPTSRISAPASGQHTLAPCAPVVERTTAPRRGGRSRTRCHSTLHTQRQTGQAALPRRCCKGPLHPEAPATDARMPHSAHLEVPTGSPCQTRRLPTTRQ